MIRVAPTPDPRGAPRQRGGGTAEATGPVSANVLKCVFQKDNDENHRRK